MESTQLGWQDVANVWKTLKPPMRVTDEEISVYENFLLKSPNNSKKILMYGATPELRDFLAKNKCDVTMLDINPVMVDAMTSLVKTKNRNERFVNTDWRTANLDERFDVAIGDHILNNIPFSAFDTVLERMSRLLKPNGRLILSTMVNPFEKVLMFNDFLKKFRSEKNLWTNREEKWLHLYNACYTDPKLYNKNNFTFVWPTTTFVKSLIKDIDDKEANAISDGIDSTNNVYCASPTRDVVEKIISRHFEILDSSISKKHPVYEIYRIYFAKPKK